MRQVFLGQVGRHLKHDEGAGPGDAEELADVTDGAGTRHVLEDDLAVDEIEGPVLEDAQIIDRVQNVLDPGSAAVKLRARSSMVGEISTPTTRLK